MDGPPSVGATVKEYQVLSDSGTQRESEGAKRGQDLEEKEVKN